MLKLIHLHRILLAATLILLFSSGPARADSLFNGSYAVANWSTTLTNSNGWVDISGAPSSVTLWGSDYATYGFGETLFSITAPSATNLSFGWVYNTFDCCGGYWDPAGYEINGTEYQLSLNLGPYVGSSGWMSVPLNAGDNFGFYVDTVDNILGRGELTVSGTPEPVSMLLFGTFLSLAGGVLARKKRAL